MANQAIAAGTVVNIATYRIGAEGIDWSERGIVERVTAKHRAPSGHFDAIASGYVPVRFASGGAPMVPSERLAVADDQSRKARAAFRAKARQ